MLSIYQKVIGNFVTTRVLRENCITACMYPPIVDERFIKEFSKWLILGSNQVGFLRKIILSTRSHPHLKKALQELYVTYFISSKVKFWLYVYQFSKTVIYPLWIWTHKICCRTTELFAFWIHKYRFHVDVTHRCGVKEWEQNSHWGTWNYHRL